MNVTFRLRIDNPADAKVRRFSLRLEVPYLHAPRIGEAVVLPAKDANGDLGARRVADVIYEPGGGIILDFQLDGFFNDVEPQVETLNRAGYTEIT
jgi:hypothetical protein